MLAMSEESFEGGPSLYWAEEERRGTRVRLAVRGALERSPEVLRFKSFVEERYVDDGVTEIDLGLDRIDRITLEGAAVLLEIRGECDRRGKKFVVEEPSQAVRARLATLGLVPYLEVRRSQK
jgi:ABC-type transporter Mla MlaB component